VPPAARKETVLTTEQLVKIYGGRAVVDGINMHVGASEIVGLLGPNGAVKRQALHDCRPRQTQQRARYFLGYRRYQLSDVQTRAARHGLFAAGRIDLSEDDGGAKHHGDFGNAPIEQNRRRNRCDQLLHQFGIERIAKNVALTLSGARNGALTIARSLVTQPKLLMRDEPFSGVDPIAVYDVQQIIVNLRKLGARLMITDHNVRETLSIVDRAYLIYEGRVESEGTKDFLINDPISRQLTLANAFKM